MAMIKRFHVVVSGKVQGVFFRAHTQTRAQELGLSGWVRNEPNGSVAMEFEGPEPDCQAMLEWCQQGSPRARVERVAAREVSPKQEIGFAVLR